MIGICVVVIFAWMNHRDLCVNSVKLQDRSLVHSFANLSNKRALYSGDLQKPDKTLPSKLCLPSYEVLYTIQNIPGYIKMHAICTM